MIFAGFLAPDAETLGEAECRNAVDDAEIDHLGGAAHLGQELVHRHAVNAAGGGGVDVVPGGKGLAHGGVAADRRHHPEFDLRIVRAEKSACPAVR